MARKDLGSIGNIGGSNVQAGDTLPQHVMVVDANGVPVAAASGGTASTDKAAFTASGSAGTPAMVARDDAATSTLAEGEMGIVRGTQYRSMHVTLYDSADNELSVGGGVQYTSLDVDASPTGNVILAMQGSTVLALQCSTNTPSTGSLGLWVREIPSTRVQEVVPQTGAAWSVAVPAVAVVATVTSVADTASSAQLLGLLATRKGYKLFNDSTEVAYVKEGTTATTSDYSYQIQPLGFYESVGLGCYTGRIDCIWANNASGAMKITELV